jgi:MEMO1 family protein
VPILCCFPYLPPGGEAALPYPPAWIAAFWARLRELLDERTALVLGVDFAHIGRRFGDARGGIDRREACETEDRKMMEAICSGEPALFRETIDRVRDARRICGYPAILTLLEVAPGLRGEVLDYGQALEEGADSLVSFGAIAFRRSPEERPS